jgi:excisionase family DNA binding protein
MTATSTDDNRRPGRRPPLDVPGLAAYLNVSIRHVRRLVSERRVPHHKVGHLVRFDPDEIDVWFNENRRGPGDAPAA